MQVALDMRCGYSKDDCTGKERADIAVAQLAQLVEQAVAVEVQVSLRVDRTSVLEMRLGQKNTW